jgi:hypothetical protein
LYLYVFGGTDTRIPRRLNVDSELTVWSWFQSTLLFACAALLAVAALMAYRMRDRYVRHWLVLSLALLWVSVDEAASIHELTIAPLHNALDTHGIFYFAWVIPALLVVAMLGLAYVRFLGNLPREVRTLFICAAGTYVIGALGGDSSGVTGTRPTWRRQPHLCAHDSDRREPRDGGDPLGIVAVLTYFFPRYARVGDTGGGVMCQTGPAQLASRTVEPGSARRFKAAFI